jgi:hypothetical protein
MAWIRRSANLHLDAGRSLPQPGVHHFEEQSINTRQKNISCGRGEAKRSESGTARRERRSDAVKKDRHANVKRSPSLHTRETQDPQLHGMAGQGRRWLLRAGSGCR